MSRVRNADEFLLRFRSARRQYEELFQKRIEDIRAIYARNPSGRVPQFIDDSLEAHVRVYLVNTLLSALNWRLGVSPEESLPALVPEAPVASSYTGSIRFLDYLGLDEEGNNPLLIVETKRPSSQLPKRKREPARGACESWASTLCAGLSGVNIGQQWNEWLTTLICYVRSVRDKSGKVPRRVVMTNGEWLILFIDPEDAFLESGSRDPMKVFVYEDRDDIADRYKELFLWLEHQRVLGDVPALTVGEVPFHVRPEIVDQAMYGLRLLYIEQPGFYEASPVIKVMPVVFLRSRYGAWLRVESRREEDLPHSADKLFEHLENVKRIATELLADINTRLGTALVSTTLVGHYANEESFDTLPGVKEITYRAQGRASEFLVVTGDHTHYLLMDPSVTDCPHHLWVHSNAEGCATNPGPIEKRSVDPRSFFKSGERHHCAHQEVTIAKASQITASNRDRCGLRSGQEGQAFCEIWRFEEHLCCRTCAFEKVCTKTQVFVLPCQRPKEKLERLSINCLIRRREKLSR